MENSTTCMSKPLSPPLSEAEEEESGWTFYFEDFLSYNNDNTATDEQNSSCLYKTSLCDDQVSDAASSAKKLTIISDDLHKSIKKLGSFKKRRSSPIAAAAALLLDDALQDTATSPANSPKVISYSAIYFINFSLYCACIYIQAGLTIYLKFVLFTRYVI